MLILLENMQILLSVDALPRPFQHILLDCRGRALYDGLSKGRIAAQNRKRRINAMKYECPCGYIYDPEVGDPDSGIAPGTAFEDIPDDWVCPVCGLGKDAFTQV